MLVRRRKQNELGTYLFFGSAACEVWRYQQFPLWIFPFCESIFYIDFHELMYLYHGLERQILAWDEP